MGWFWADHDSIETKVLKCPVNHGQLQPPSSCPVKHESAAPVCPVKHESAPVCPVNHDTFINPSNNMPFTISSDKAPGQKIDLPKERTLSSIPRGTSDNEGVWEYPSPQQMLNAMLRKGKGDIPEDAVESMVDVHNWLNEAAWREILEWEKPYIDQTQKTPRLLKFIGKPQELSPRARMYLALSSIFPDKFNENPPFDRHDWTILRPGLNDTQIPVRYVIDYYGGPDDEDSGMPTFYLDVRPALDSFGNAWERFNKWNLDVVKPTVNKALGRT